MKINKPFEDRMLGVIGDPDGDIYRERLTWYYTPSGLARRITLGTTYREVIQKCVWLKAKRASRQTALDV